MVNSFPYLDTYLKTNFPTDSDGNLCGVDAPGYPFVYFANAPEIVLVSLFSLEEFVFLVAQRKMLLS